MARCRFGIHCTKKNCTDDGHLVECPYGTRCTICIPKPPPPPPVPTLPKKPCKTFLETGTCKFGKGCHFSHETLCKVIGGGGGPDATTTPVVANIAGGGGPESTVPDAVEIEETPLEDFLIYLGYPINTQEACDPELNKIFSEFSSDQVWYLEVMLKKQVSEHMPAVVPDEETAEIVAEEDDESDIIDGKLEIKYPDGIIIPLFIDEDRFFSAYANLAVKNFCKGNFSKTLEEIAERAIRIATINITQDQAEAVTDLINGKSLIDYTGGIPGDEDIVFVDGKPFSNNSKGCDCCHGFIEDCVCVTEGCDTGCWMCAKV
jgi:hypothetical protein